VRKTPKRLSGFDKFCEKALRNSNVMVIVMTILFIIISFIKTTKKLKPLLINNHFEI